LFDKKRRKYRSVLKTNGKDSDALEMAKTDAEVAQQEVLDHRGKHKLETGKFWFNGRRPYL
jgi:hypothetical protein